MLDVEIASCTDVGARQSNEDYLQHGELETGWFAVLSDGAGGHSDGAVAADLVVRLVAHGVSAAFGDASSPALQHAGLALGAVVIGANDALNQRQQGLTGAKRMHATLVALWLDKQRDQAVWSHVGDSRLYLLRRGRIARVTRDDSVVQTLVDAGLIAPAQARSHANRNQLIAAMGSDEPIDPHVGEEVFALADGDAFLLSSDGWHDPIEPREIESTLADASSAHDWLERMRTLVRDRARPNQDNYSAIAVWVGDPAEVTQIDAGP